MTTRIREGLLFWELLEASGKTGEYLQKNYPGAIKGELLTAEHAILITWQYEETSLIWLSSANVHSSLRNFVLDKMKGGK